MVSPSAINGSKTIEHDDIHLWLHNKNNLSFVVNTHHKDLEDKNIDIKNVNREISLYSPTNFNVGVTDCLVEYSISINNPTRSDFNMNSKGWSSGGGGHYFKDCVLIIEIKPRLGSVSGIIGQVKSYKDNLTRVRHLTSVGMAVITYDKNQKYDALFTAEGITVFRIDNPLFPNR